MSLRWIIIVMKSSNGLPMDYHKVKLNNPNFVTLTNKLIQLVFILIFTFFILVFLVMIYMRFH
ncbi:hypothetical protein P3G55_06820 [Leptospira sp. 96542]|nr:hypothetical protein [Leptospira sp. 96542]